MGNRSTAKGLGLVCAAVSLLFAMVSINYGWGGGNGLSASVGFAPASVLQIYQRQMYSYGSVDPIWLFRMVGDLLSGVLAAILLLVAAARGGRAGTFAKLLPVMVPVLWNVADVLLIYAEGDSPGFSSELVIHVVALVAFTLVSVLGRPGSRASVAVAFALSIASLVMLMAKIDPFGLDVGGAKGYFSMYVGTLIYYVALWFGTAFVLMIEPESVPGVAAPTLLSAGRSTSAEAVASQLPANHPYRSLGGFLAFMVYGSYVCGALLAVIELYNVFRTFSVLGQYAASGMTTVMGSTITVLFVLWALDFAMVGYSFWWASALKNRNPNFLRNYHLVAIMIIAAYFFAQLLVRPIATALLTAVVEVLAIALGTFYFVSSVRVHAYFGSDEYLRRSPFTRGFATSQRTAYANVGVGVSTGSAGGMAGVGGRGANSAGRMIGGARGATYAARYDDQQTSAFTTHRCPKCGATLRDGALFCGSCGSSVAVMLGRGAKNRADFPHNAKTQTIRCPTCGLELEQGDQFCGRCGGPIGDVRPQDSSRDSQSKGLSLQERVPRID